MVAGYLPPSHFAWSDADWARFPTAVKVRIAIFASVNDGHVLDVEQGDATPAQAPGWVAMRRRAGVDPTVYCNASTWPQVRSQHTLQGVPQPHYWIARYDGDPTIPAGAVAKQYADPAKHGAGHFDLSIVADYWPGVDTPKENDVDPTDPARDPGPDKWGHVWLNTMQNAQAVRGYVDTVEPRLVAIQAAIAADKGVSAAELARIVDAAVAAHTPNAAQVVEALKPLLTSTLLEVLGTDNTDQADAIVDALVARLNK